MRERSGLVMVQRDEGLLLALNVRYHLSLGVTKIVIVDNHSEDTFTRELLVRLASAPDVHVLQDDSHNCDQAALANRGLAALLAHGEIEWVFPCDADEFLWSGEPLESFLARCRQDGILYGTLPWLNHLPDQPATEVDPLAYIRGGSFYTPFPETQWHEAGHFRKAFCARHDGMQIVVGGHYFRREANPAFFNSLRECPANLPPATGTIVHFEMRDCGRALLRKCRDLSTRHIAANGPWREKENMLGTLWKEYASKENLLFSAFARSRRTLRGNPIPVANLERRDNVTRTLTSLLECLSSS